MSKPAEVWGPHWRCLPSDVGDEIRNDPHYPLACTMIAIAGAPHIMALEEQKIEDPPNLHAVRGVLARLLAKSSDPDRFHTYALDSGASGRPSEEIREYTQGLLGYLASLTGLLHASEVEYIKNYSGGHAPQYFYDKKNELLYKSRDQVVEASKLWKSQGYKIGIFQGAFDPVIQAHLANATESFLWTQNRGEKLKLIWIFDSSELIKRKGPDRPRFPNIIKRRESIEGFWNVSATVESSVKNVGNLKEHALEYEQLGADYVFVPLEDNVRLVDRRDSANLAGAEAIALPYEKSFTHSSDVMRIRAAYLETLKTWITSS